MVGVEEVECEPTSVALLIPARNSHIYCFFRKCLLLNWFFPFSWMELIWWRLDSYSEGNHHFSITVSYFFCDVHDASTAVARLNLVGLKRFELSSRRQGTGTWKKESFISLQFVHPKLNRQGKHKCDIKPSGLSHETDQQNNQPTKMRNLASVLSALVGQT